MKTWHLGLLRGRRPARTPSVTPAIEAEVVAREGRVCTYCGDLDGPFEFDHIFPLVRGGSNAASNLTLACGPCNRAKAGRTLRDWMRQ